MDLNFFKVDWDAFEAMLLQNNASNDEIRVAKEAFYYGILATIRAIVAMKKTGRDENFEMIWLEFCTLECQAFCTQETKKIIGLRNG